MRGRITHASKEAFTWEQDLREKWEADEQALLSDRKELQRRMAPGRRRLEEPASTEPRLLTDVSGGGAPAAAAANGWHELVLAINLDRREDRLKSLQALPWGLELERLAAVDGRTLSWDALVEDGSVSRPGADEARYAEVHALPTICRKVCSFSPHLTLAAVGCALSHRRAWERIARQSACDWGLVLEDDVSAITPNFADQLRQCVRRLPRTWAFCYLGFHEADEQLLPHGGMPSLREVGEGATLTGLFGYLLTREGAAQLTRDTSLFPLRHQIDFALTRRSWPRGTRFTIDPANVLLKCPRSEDDDGNTDVQTLGEKDVDAHAHMPADMIKLG